LRQVKPALNFEAEDKQIQFRRFMFEEIPDMGILERGRQSRFGRCFSRRRSTNTEHHSSTCKLGRQLGIDRVFLVDWKELTAQQQDAILEKISKRFGASKEVILKDVLKVGLPLREKFTEGGGTIRLELFLQRS
jgi:hypothetical protein